MSQALSGWPDDGRWHYRRSLASRVGVLTALVVGLSITVMALTAFVVMRMQLQTSLDSSLLNRAEKAAQSPALSELTAQGISSWVLGAADVRVSTVTANGVVRTGDVAGPHIVLGSPELAVASGTRQDSVRTIVADDGTRYRVAAVRAGTDQAGTGQALVLAQALTTQDQTLRRLSTVLAIFGGLGVFAAALAGWAVAANGLRPVRRLTAAAEHIAVTEDLTPLRVEGDDEVARLSAAFNQMLQALSASRDRQRRLVADASHELRTPLTSLRTNLDLLRQADGNGGLPADARAELLDDVRAQIEEMSSLIGDLVVLAREDQPVERELVDEDLAQICERALARVRRRAPGLDFAVDLAAWPVRVEANGVERAVTNLLDNAAKWSPAGATVDVHLADGVLTVDDQGPGVPEGDRPHVFERFYRSDDSRSMPGSGLGLAIVKQVVERHGGQVSVGDAPAGGARFSLWLPGAIPQTPATAAPPSTAPRPTRPPRRSAP